MVPRDSCLALELNASTLAPTTPAPRGEEWGLV